jgi:hypothetical protein
MTPQQYIDFLAARGFKLSVHDGQLRVSNPKQLGPGTLGILKRFKPEIVAALHDQRAIANNTPCAFGK